MQPFPSYGGQKFAFRALPEGNSQHAEKIRQVGQAIDTYRRKKRALKEGIERDRETAIKKAEEVAAAAQRLAVAGLLSLRPDQVGPDNVGALIDGMDIVGKRQLDAVNQQVSAAKIAQNKIALRDYHAAVMTGAGWQWSELRAALERIDGVTVDDVKLVPGEGLAYVKVGGDPIYLLYLGQASFAWIPSSRGFGGDVYVKPGYEGYYYQTSKEFVRDSNRVWTRRYVTRAVTIFHLASMFGLAIEPPKRTQHPLDDDLPVRLRRQIMPGGTPPTVRVATFSGAATDLRILDEQRARYQGKEFSGHAEVFNLGTAAIVDWKPPNPDFLPYQLEKLSEAVGEKTGVPVLVGVAKGRDGSTQMGHSERASMQVRNGSGPVQPYLSAASIQWSGKVIRANKGERFDEGAENQATLEIDLSLAAGAGVDIVNQHSDPSHRFKIAYDRYYDPEDITALERMVYRTLAALVRENPSALARLLDNLSVDDLRNTAIEKIGGSLAKRGRQVVGEIGLDPKAFDGLSDGAVAHIIALDGPSIDVRQEKPRRLAAAELDEYIYSARKNREVLLDRIPISCVVAIKLNNAAGKWLAVDPTSFPGLSRALETEDWHGFSELRAELVRYLTGDAGDLTDPYGRIKAMYMHAAEDKLEESGRT